VQAGLLTGHVALFTSMWLHARHVVHLSADPAPGPNRIWRIPRPHFRVSRPKWIRAGDAGIKTVESQQAPLEGPQTERKRPVNENQAESANQAASDAIPASPAAMMQAERPAKPRIRFDGRHQESSGQLPSDESRDPDQSDAVTGATGASTGKNELIDGVDEAQQEEGPGDGSAKPELRGLSKKQRRRLMQELRDRERASRQ